MPRVMVRGVEARTASNYPEPLVAVKLQYTASENYRRGHGLTVGGWQACQAGHLQLGRCWALELLQQLRDVQLQVPGRLAALPVRQRGGALQLLRQGRRRRRLAVAWGAAAIAAALRRPLARCREGSGSQRVGAWSADAGQGIIDSPL